jgi:hypothetical protein
MYTKGKPATLDPEVGNRANAALKELKMARTKKASIKFFPVFGDDVFSAGGLSLAKGAIVGIPHNFSYKRVEDMDLTQVTVFNNQSVKWNSKAGKRLLESCVLSEKAQKFAIAREIWKTDTEVTYFESGNYALGIFLWFVINKSILTHYKLYSRPLAVKLGVTMLSGLVALTNYFILNDGYHTYLDKSCDAKAVDTGPEYFDGAIEYYTKLLQRNKALRRLMGNDGAKYWSPDGNVYNLLRTPTMPLTDRITAIQNIKEAEDDF